MASQRTGLEGKMKIRFTWQRDVRPAVLSVASAGSGEERIRLDPVAT